MKKANRHSPSLLPQQKPNPTKTSKLRGWRWEVLVEEEAGPGMDASSFNPSHAKGRQDHLRGRDEKMRLGDVRETAQITLLVSGRADFWTHS